MADSKQQDDSFRVIDRRLFNPDGEIRDEAARAERALREAEPPKAAAKTASPAAPAAAGQAQPSPAAVAEPAAADTPADMAADIAAGVTTDLAAEQPKPLRGLEMLINFVAQNAAMLLGAYPDPRTGQAMLDLEGARELIDMLDALREATRGNLAAEDDHLLLEVLGSLKLSFMEMTKAAAKAMKDKAKAQG